jgi:MATE family multidrug resistance protein
MQWAAIRAEVPGLFGLAVPIVVGLAASNLLGVTDSLMLAPLGPVPLAAVGLTMSIAIILIAAIYGMLSALSVRIGAAFGAGDQRRIPLLLRNGLALGGLVGLLGAAVMGTVWFILPLLGQPPEVLAAMPAYWACISLLMIPFALLTVFKSAFEAVGRPWLGTGFAFVAVVVNIPLNYALIWGIGPLPQLGLTGAGVASLLAEVLALAVAWGWWMRAPGLRRLRLRRPLLRSEMAAAFREGAPLGALYVAETGAMAVGTLLIGMFGTLALAGNQVAMSVGGLLYMVPLGVAGAVSIRVAQAKGAGAVETLRPIVWAALGIGLTWLSGSALVLGLFGAEIARMITSDPGIVAVAAAIFLVFAISQIADGVQSTMLGALRGMSDTGWPAGVSIIAYWVVALPLGWVFARWLELGPAGIWLGFVAALFGAAAALVWRFLARTRPDPA